MLRMLCVLLTLAFPVLLDAQATRVVVNPVSPVDALLIARACEPVGVAARNDEAFRTFCDVPPDTAGIAEWARTVVVPDAEQVRYWSSPSNQERPFVAGVLVDSGMRTDRATTDLNTGSSTDWAFSATDVVLSRGHEAVNEWLTQVAMDRLCGDKPKWPGLKDHLEETCTSMNQFSSIQYRTQLNVLRTAIVRDARVVPAAMLKAALQDDSLSAEDMRFAGVLIVRFMETALRSADPVASIRAVSEAPLDLPVGEALVRMTCDNAPVATGLFIASQLTGATFNSSGVSILDEVRETDPGKVGIRLMQALMVNNHSASAERPTIINYTPVSCESDSENGAFPIRSPEKLLPLFGYIGELVEKGVTSQSMRANWRSATTAEERQRVLIESMETGLDLLKVGLDITAIGVVDDADLVRHRVTLANNVLNSLSEAIFHAHSGDYSNATISALTAANLIRNESKSEPWVMSKDLSRVFAFTVEAASSNGDQDLGKAMAIFVNGGEGWRRKRNSDTGSYVTFNSYVGLHPAYEVVNSRGGVAAGPYMPIGFEFWRRVGSERTDSRRRWWEPAIFLQVIDLGALASWRWNLSDADDADSRPRVGIEHVFAPGGYLVWPVAQTPFSLGLGFDFAPQLRQIRMESDGAVPEFATRDRDAQRFGLFLAVDVPLFP